MNHHSQATSIIGILIACAISGLISGIIVTQDLRSILSGSGWGLLSGPGIVFGLLFSLASDSDDLRNKDQKTLGSTAFVVLFTITSTVIYFIAVQIAIRLLFSNGFIAGGLAGLFGAGALSITTKFLSETRINFRDALLTTMVGTIAGIIFFLGAESSLEKMNWSLRFIFWQVAVGWSLSRSIQRGSIVPTNLTSGNNSVFDSQQSAPEL